MKRKLFLFIAAFLLFTGCGGNFNSDNEAAVKSISGMEIGITPKTIRVGMPAQLSVTVTLSSGEQFEGLTTSFDDPNTNEMLPVKWLSSNEYSADIGDGATLIPGAPGTVTIRVDLMGKTQSKTVRIFDAYSPSLSPDPDESVAEEDVETEEGTEEEALEGAVCRGHAVSVVSFTAGSGSGFGADSLPGIVLGPPQGAGEARGSTHVLSLGRYGEVVLGLGSCALVDGAGVDLIVFENAFFISGDIENPYAELGIVGVSENGVDYFEFTCAEDGFPYTGCAGWNPVYSSPSNSITPFDVISAGGDHFDLADLGVGAARYVRIRDAGTAGFGTSVGFDLDAISVVNGIREAP